MINTKKGTVLCFGEVLLRMMLHENSRWLIENEMPVFLGGAELNVANALAIWGVPTKYVTAMPKNALSDQIIQFLSDKGIDVSGTHYFGNRLGTYYLGRGKDVKDNALIYDRAGSSFSNLKPGIIDWEKVLQGVSWLHFSAINPALSQDINDACLEMLDAASHKGITISIDLNYRANLWQYGKHPTQVIPRLASYCDLIMGNVWAAQKMLGISFDESHVQKNEKKIYLEQAEQVSKSIIECFPKCRAVANTFRFDDAEGLKYYTTLFSDRIFIESKEFNTTKVLDKVGSGDCFMAGLIYGFYSGLSQKQTLEFATAAAFDKLFHIGDATSTSAEEIMKRVISNN